MFKFKVSPLEGDSFNLNLHQLTLNLLKHVNENLEEKDQEIIDAFVKELNSYFANFDKVDDLTLKQLLSIYFLVGYYYKLFLVKNNVEIIKDE